jgi:hypothetical protein
VRTLLWALRVEAYSSKQSWRLCQVALYRYARWLFFWQVERGGAPTVRV